MEEMYYEVCSYLQECVNNDIYTEDEAQAIADVAYNRYMVEGNAYNKYASNLQDKVNKQENENDALLSALGDKAQPIISKRSETLKQKQRNFEDKAGGYHLDRYDRKGVKDSSDRRRLRGNRRSLQRAMKRNWMYNSGNRGDRPEDALKKDRYLKAQNALKDDNERKKIDIRSMNDKVRKKVAEDKQNKERPKKIYVS